MPESNSVFRTMSSDAFKTKTGKDLKTWLSILDKWGMKEKGHTATAKHLREHYGLENWWSQAVTIRYEWERKLRG